MDKKDIQDALNKGKLIHHKDNIEYYRFRTGFRDSNRGKILTKSKVVEGYPHIKRIFVIEKGLQKNIKEDTIYIEEKIDGFNIRVASIEGNILAFSRGGFIDLFSTEKVNELSLSNFFSVYPSYVLCGEMIGNTPYTPPTEGYDIKFLVFDIDRGDGTYLSVQEKYDILNKYKIESVPRLGKFKKSDIKSIKNLILRINKQDKEGIVIKSASRKEIVKYVVPSSDIQDIESAMHSFFDISPGFFLQRVFRSSLSLTELGLGKSEYEKNMGASFLSLMNCIKMVIKEGQVYNEFEILINNPKIFENIKKHMSSEVAIEKIFERSEGKKTRIRFKKIYKKTTRMLLDALNGKGQID